MKLPVDRKWWEFFRPPVSIDTPGGTLYTGDLPVQIKLHPAPMSKENFIIEVRKVVSFEDFERYNHQLDKVEPRFYQMFILLMLFNLPMNLNLTVLELIEEIGAETNLTDDQIIGLFPKYALILMMLDERFV